MNSIFEKIRCKAIVQYFSPFVSVNLNTMADALKTTVPALEKELSRLIMEGQISARIDSHNKARHSLCVMSRPLPDGSRQILYSRTTDQRSTTFEKSLQVGEECQRNTKAMLMRVNFMRNEFYVRPPRTQEEDAPSGQAKRV